jgi:hypothetical protein
MTTVKEIQTAIESLPQNEYQRLMKWIQQREAERWDEQIVQDSDTGKLDFLIEEALAEKNAGTLQSL